MPAPMASDNGRFRLGFFTSAAVNVVLFQPTAENQAPTMATATRLSVPIVHIGWSGGYGCITQSPALRQKSVKFVCRAMSVDDQNPIITNPASEPTFATVKMFWTIFPIRNPRVLIQ